MPGEGLTHGPRAVKKHGEGTTGSAGSSGIPCATVLRLITRSPRGPGFLAPVISEIISRRLDLSVGRPGPHAFAVRADDARLASSSRPSHPRLTSRDDRDTPLRKRGGMCNRTSFFQNRSNELFLRAGLYRLAGLVTDLPDGQSRCLSHRARCPIAETARRRSTGTAPMAGSRSPIDWVVNDRLLQSSSTWRRHKMEQNGMMSEPRERKCCKPA